MVGRYTLVSRILARWRRSGGDDRGRLLSAAGGDQAAAAGAGGRSPGGGPVSRRGQPLADLQSPANMLSPCTTSDLGQSLLPRDRSTSPAVGSTGALGRGGSSDWSAVTRSTPRRMGSARGWRRSYYARVTTRGIVAPSARPVVIKRLRPRAWRPIPRAVAAVPRRSRTVLARLQPPEHRRGAHLTSDGGTIASSCAEEYALPAAEPGTDGHPRQCFARTAGRRRSELIAYCRAARIRQGARLRARGWRTAEGRPLKHSSTATSRRRTSWSRRRGLR